MIPEAIGSLLHQFSKTRAFRSGLSLHTVVLKNGLQSDVFVSNHVLNLYAKCGNFSFARQVFDEMSERNLVSWSAMISGYDQCGEHLMALDLYSQLRLVPNEYIFASAVSACGSLREVVQGKQIHAQSVKFGYASISFVSNSLISMYMKCGQCSDALSVSASTLEPSHVSYNALITGFIDNKQSEKGFEVFKHMHQKGFVPDQFTFVGLLGFCTESDDLRMGMLLHCQTIKIKLDSTAFIGNVIMTMYARFKLIEEAERAFKLIEEKDVISWNTMITAYSYCDDHGKVLEIFKEMKHEYGIRPDDFTFSSILAACAGHAPIRYGKQIHGHLLKTRPYQDVGVGNALVSMYAKCGCIGYGYTVFKKMLRHNLVSWNTIIAGFGNNGLGGRAIEVFEQMKTLGVKPDSLTFVGLLVSCNHAGLVDKGKDYFNSMDEIYGISPNVLHVSCLVDMLGRAGRLSEAEDNMKKFHYENDPIVLGSLLSACRLHGNVVIGEPLARQLLQLQPQSTSPFVLLSNMYASDEMWDDVADARKIMKGSGLRKEAGHSLVEVKGNFEKFIKGDFSHLRNEEIKDILRTLNWAISMVSANFVT
ncbi:putative Pentatricopeptide repeat-containing protein [Quillaja saponaria]|uniref:Pentatricopeptide repeat-containing protein n=1 Tax=Quillaja saponaria TaxID=32244 RepID=A0AAD7QDA1_QUISA|nr:putative Pentatricopeptide repeat-containing protein [Quillaja saponaria]